MNHSITLRRGFTLIELLVVIAIIAILMALMVPAVQKVREASARSQCQNNTKQIALALHAYHDAKKTLPHALMFRGTGNPLDRNQSFGPNWAVLILPYIEQGPLYDTVSSNVNNYMSDGNTTWRSVKGERINLFVCPSDDSTREPFKHAGGGWARGNYAVNSGPAMWCSGSGSAPNNNNQCTSSTINKSGIDRNATPQVSRGIVGPAPAYPGATSNVLSSPVMGLNFGRKLAHITDGTSATLAVEEIRVGPDENDIRGTWALGLVGASVIAGTGRNDNPYPNWSQTGGDDIHGCTDDLDRDLGCGNTSSTGATVARSRHRGGANVAFCDGSVRFMKNDIGQVRWFLLHSATDENVVDLDY